MSKYSCADKGLCLSLKNRFLSFLPFKSKGGCGFYLLLFSHIFAAALFYQPAYATEIDIPAYNPIRGEFVIKVHGYVCIESHPDIILFKNFMTQYEAKVGDVKITFFGSDYRAKVSVYRAERALPPDSNCPEWALEIIPKLQALFIE